MSNERVEHSPLRGGSHVKSIISNFQPDSVWNLPDNIHSGVRNNYVARSAALESNSLRNFNMELCTYGVRSNKFDWTNINEYKKKRQSPLRQKENVIYRDNEAKMRSDIVSRN
jgi:hypothetical protein